MRARSSCASSRTPGWRTSCAATSPRLPHGTVFPVSYCTTISKAWCWNGAATRSVSIRPCWALPGNIAMNRAPFALDQPPGFGIDSFDEIKGFDQRPNIFEAAVVSIHDKHEAALVEMNQQVLAVSIDQQRLIGGVVVPQVMLD